MMKQFTKGDKVRTKDGEGTVREAKPDGFYVVRLKGKRAGRSYWGGNLEKRD